MIGVLTSLYDLVLYDNDLTGTVPTEIGIATTMRSMLLNDNNLTGSIPTELSELTAMAYLRLSNNSLTGNVPPELVVLLEELEDDRCYLGCNDGLTGVPYNCTKC